MRLIDADALMQSLGITDMDCNKCEWHDSEWNDCKRGGDFEDTCCAIEHAPTIEPECKTGKWNRRKGMYEVGFKCSECNSFSITETPYCSFCGARMVQEGEDNG